MTLLRCTIHNIAFGAEGTPSHEIACPKCSAIERTKRRDQVREREQTLNMSEPAEPEKPAVRCTGLLAELEAALRRDACIIARIARRGDDPKKDPAFARYCALEDAYEAERRYSANKKLSAGLGEKP